MNKRPHFHFGPQNYVARAARIWAPLWAVTWGGSFSSLRRCQRGETAALLQVPRAWGSPRPRPGPCASELEPDGRQEGLSLTAGTRHSPWTRLAAPGGVRGRRSVGRLNKQSRWRRRLALGGEHPAFPAFRASRCPPPGPGGGREIIRRGRSAPGGPGWPPAPGVPGRCAQSGERGAAGAQGRAGSGKTCTTRAGAGRGGPGARGGGCRRRRAGRKGTRAGGAEAARRSCGAAGVVEDGFIWGI